MMLRRSTRFFSSASAPAPRAGVDWENFGFKLNRTEHMYLYEGPPPVFQKGKVLTFFSPAARVAVHVVLTRRSCFADHALREHRA